MRDLATTLANLYEFDGTVLTLDRPRAPGFFRGPVRGRFLIAEEGWDPWAAPDTQTLVHTGSGTVAVRLRLALPGRDPLPVTASRTLPVDVYETAASGRLHYPGGQPADLLAALEADVAELLPMPAGDYLGRAGRPSLRALVEREAELVFQIDAGGAHGPGFPAGTPILTGRGPVAVEHLRPGDHVRTLDNGLCPVRQVARRRHPAGPLSPVRLAAGVLGNDAPLVLSPLQRVLVRDWRAELHFGAPEVLVAARHLPRAPAAVREGREGRATDYIAFRLDMPEIVFAGGIPCESHHPGLRGRAAARPVVLGTETAILGRVCPLAPASAAA